MPDMRKKHNYLLVYGDGGETHYLDRYASTPVTLCGVAADPHEVEHDDRAYDLGVDCTACFDVLSTRVMSELRSQPAEAHDVR